MKSLSLTRISLHNWITARYQSIKQRWMRYNPIPTPKSPGALQPSEVLKTSEISAPLPATVLPDSAPAESLTKKDSPEMTILVSTIAAAVASVYQVEQTLVAAFDVLKPYVVTLMDSAESAFSAATTAGSSKLAAVLAGVKALAATLGVTWSTGLEAAINALIAAAKATYNAFISAGTAAIAEIKGS